MLIRMRPTTSGGRGNTRAHTKKMLQYALTHNEPKRAKSIRFGLLSPDEIERMAVCEITETTLYYRGLPASGGLLDPLMGSVDRRHLCATCMCDAKTCQGHPGFIRLAYPVYHTGFIESVLRTLRCACFFCSRVCATPEDVQHVADTTGKGRLTAMHAILRTRKTCPHCAAPHPTFSRVSLGIKIDWPADVFESPEEEAFCRQVFTAREAHSILRNMPDEDVELLGFDPQHSHPMHMITHNLVVCPPCSRPAIYSSEGSRSRGQNDLTQRFLEVLKRSHEVKHFMKEQDVADLVPNAEFMELLSRLQYEAFMLINNSVRLQRPAGMGRNGCANLKSLTERLKGKEGRVRGNLMGKRVDFSARCVISPDAYFDCDRVGVPNHIAARLTVPEVVNATNIHVLSERVRIGAGNVKGADTVVPQAGGVILLEHCVQRDAIVLRPGDVVERYLQDNDVVVFNRQPSLHLHSMQAHRVTLMPGYTFRLSLAIAAPYNADFDGDEMNLHVAQSKLAMAECETLLGVAHNCIDSQANKPAIGIVQDALLGAYLITRRVADVFPRERACRILACMRHAPRKLPPPALRVKEKGAFVPYWTGKQILSMAFPCDLFVGSIGTRNLLETPHEEFPVVVAHGTLLCGVLSKSSLGTSSGGIIDVVCRDFDGVACLRTMADIQRIANAYLLQRAHHVGIHDVLFCEEGHKNVCERMRKIVHLCDEIQRGLSDAPKEVHVDAEAAVLRMLSKTLLQVGGIVNEHMSLENSIRSMVAAGSKGSFVNLSQICACLGQQQLEGARITAEDGGRALPSFASDDKSLLGRGMVFNSFALGLSPTELFFHGIGGREGLVDTAVKTSQTGYLQRRMNKSMEDHHVTGDGIVRNASKEIISFKWGSDGYHPARVERVVLDVLKMTEREMASRYTPEERVLLHPHLQRVHLAKRNILCSEYDARVLLPFQKRRMEEQLRRSPGTPAIEEVSDVAKRVAQQCEKSGSSATIIALLDLFRNELVRVTQIEVVLDVLDVCQCRIENASNTCGDSVGCIAAQSIGESFTQMTLNSFHTSGCGHQTVSMGIPRLRELMDASRSKTPCTIVRLRAPFRDHVTVAQEIANSLPLTLLADITDSWEIRSSSDGDDDLRRVEEYLFSGTKPSNYVIRLVLSEGIMKTRGITPPAVRRLILERLGERAAISASEVNSLSWVLRIQLRGVQKMITHGGLNMEEESVLCHRVAQVLLQTTVVAGHSGVRHAAIQQETDGTHSIVAYGLFLRDCAASQCVDWASCTTTDIWEVYQTLGIEACCHVFFEQLKSVVCFDGRTIDDRHLIIVTDTVCRNGYIMALNRHGINRIESSPLMRASFEETIDILGDAALYAARENARGVTTNIMTGQLANFGSGDAHVLIPESCVTQKMPLRVEGRCIRSTCRSSTSREETEFQEYVLDDVRLTAPRSLSPCEERARKRARFRLVSPPRNGK